MDDEARPEDTATIKFTAQICASYLGRLLQKEEALENEDLVDHWASHQFAEFNLWCARLGVNGHGLRSIDLRLKDVPEICDIIMQLLQSLQQDLESLQYAVDAPKEFSEVSDVPEKDNDSSSEDSNLSFDSMSSLSQSMATDTPENANAHDQATRQHIENTIERLHGFSLHVGRLGNKHRQERIELYMKRNDTQFAFEGYKRLAQYRAKSHFPSMSAPEFLHVLERMVESFARRRIRFEYLKSHQRKRAVEAPSVRHDKIDSRITGPSGAPICCATSQELTTTKNADVVKAINVSQRARQEDQRTMLSATEITKLEVVPEMTPERADSVVSITLQHGIPPPPRLNGAKSFQCPYCRIELRAHEAHNPQWGQHVLQDFQPYFCLDKGCQSPFDVPNNFDGLLDHMQQHFHEQYHVDMPNGQHQKFTEIELDTYINKHFHSSIDNISLLKDSSRRKGVLLFEKCPFCGGYPDDVEKRFPNPNDPQAQIQLRRHIKKHMQDIALFLPPARSDISEKDNASVEGSNSTRRKADLEEFGNPDDYVLVCGRDDCDCQDQDRLPRTSNHELGYESFIPELLNGVSWAELFPKFARYEPSRITEDYVIEDKHLRRLEDDNLPQSSPPTETDLSCIRNGHEPRETDIFLAVLGATGVGKSSFISHLTTDENKPEVGHNLNSCTQDVKVYQYAYSATCNIYLIDTPGFDDTYRTDKSVLRSLVSWLSLTYKHNIRLHGILYLHRITDVRMQGSAKGSVTLFRQLCGADNLKHVVLVTTMWNKLEKEDFGVSREAQLVENEEFWGCMVKRGSRVERHYDTAESARKLIDMFLPQEREQSDGPVHRMELAIQREMVDQHKVLESTSAGQEVCNNLNQEEEEIKTCIAEYNADMIRIREERGLNMLQELEDLEKQISIARGRSERICKHRQAEMKKSMETLIRDNFDKNDQEPEEDKKRRLAKEYVVGEFAITTDTGGTQDNSRPNSYVVPRVTSPGFAQAMGQWWSNRDRKKINVSMSIRGKFCSLIGPAYRKSYLPPSTRSSVVRLQESNNIKMMNIILGENSSYYTHYHEGWVFRKCYYHGSLRATYPDLYSFISGDGNTSCPTGISLGPQGSYFINVSGRKSLHCHPDANLPPRNSLQDIRRLWWGASGSYVLEQEDSKLLWDLRGNYGGLENALLELERSHSRIKELALDIESPAAFALITEDSIVMEGTANVVHSHFREFATQNFGSRMANGGS